MADALHSVLYGMATDDLLCWRAEFPILERSLYLVSHSLGAMPRRVRDRLAEFADTWATRGVLAWEEGWWEMPRTVGDLIGRIIGAGAGEVVMHQNQTLAQATVLSALYWASPRNGIVTEQLNFPSNLYLFHEFARDGGARVVTVDSDDGRTVSLERMLAAIDDTTALVSISHVVFKSGFVQDVVAITRRAHDVGALVLVDLYQSAGTVPVDVRAWGVDFATGGSVKWLCGGPGAGYLYVRAGLAETLAPKLTGWMAHRAPFAFATGPIEYAGDAYRFLNGSPSVPALYAARSGYEIISDVGVDRIRAKSVRQTTRLMALADEAGISVASPRTPAERGGIVVLDVQGADVVTHALAERGVLVDSRPEAGIRVSPHFYTTDEEIDRFMQELIRAIPTATRSSTAR